MPPVRAHPSVPISSSRTSEREASPARAGRKRASENTENEPASSRPRLSEEEDDDDRYGSRFSRNGMGNGGVYGVSNYYGNNPVSTDGDYTSGILPMFNGTNNAFHNMHDPNHLEDASVLLSMAYPGGVPGSDASPTIGMVLGETGGAEEAAAAATTKTDDATENNEATVPTSENEADSAKSGFDSGAVENPARPAAPGAVLPESMGNLDGSISWLNANGQDGGDASNWLSSDSSRPLSPFNMTNLFNSSSFNLLSNETTAMAIAAAAAAATAGVSPNTSNSEGEQQQNQQQQQTQQQPQRNVNDVVARILEQLAMNDVPETRANPNPERPLLRLANKEIVIRSGSETPQSSRFYLPSDRFAGCYQIPHWGLPPLRTLSLMAARTYYTVLNHCSFVHEPTFQLIDTAACLAFAICTVGGIRPSGRNLALAAATKSTAQDRLLDSAWEGVFNDYGNFGVGVDPEEEEDRRRVEEWEGGQIVRHEKTNMLVKSFSLAKGVLMSEYNVALLQALILYHAPYFLSEHEHERRQANMFLATIVNITRQIGFFSTDEDHVKPTTILPTIPFSPAELTSAWKRWVHLESRRRTAFLVYHLDTVSALESNFGPAIIHPSEVAHIPLPAPDSVWKAGSAEEWYRACQSWRPMTLDEAMRRTFDLPSSGPLDEAPKGLALDPNLLQDGEYGAFARTAIIMTLLRGIMDLGEGRRSHGDWRDLTDLWISANHLRPSKVCLSADGFPIGQCSPEALRARFSLGLQRWRAGWDADPSCVQQATSPAPSIPTPAASTPGTVSDTGSSIKGAPRPVYCEEALPFYVLANSLMEVLAGQPPTPQPGFNAFSNVKYDQMLNASRILARAGEI